MRRRLLLPFAVLAAVLGLLQPPVGSQQSASDARAQREQVREEKADAARELDAAEADDEAVHAALVAITSSVNAYQAEIDEAQRQLDDARAQVATAEAAIVEADEAEAALLDELASVAVAGYVSGGEQSVAMFGSEDIVEALRQSSLLDKANGDTADLLEDLRIVHEDRELAAADAAAALVEAESLEIALAEDLVVLEAEKAVQEELKAELERRVAEWQSKVDELAAADAELTQFIKEQEAAAAAASGGGSTAPAPGSSSVSGFQWPVSGGVSSGYGYRVHPIYGTRRLHTGLDISGGSGTPIAAAKAGTVLSAGWRGGYGNAVVISHGGGISHALCPPITDECHHRAAGRSGRHRRVGRIDRSVHGTTPAFRSASERIARRSPSLPALARSSPRSCATRWHRWGRSSHRSVPQSVFLRSRRWPEHGFGGSRRSESSEVATGATR